MDVGSAGFGWGVSVTARSWIGYALAAVAW
jgi:hypothetical protein